MNRFIYTPHSKYLPFLVFKMMLSFSFMLHLFNAVVFGMAYLQMGNDVGRVFDYTALLFLALLLLMFSALMAAILTCKTPNTMT